MISYIDGKVYIQVPPDAVDVLAVAVLKEGRGLAEDSLGSTFTRIFNNGGRVEGYLMEDLTDNLKYLDAFNTLLEYYGAE